MALSVCYNSFLGLLLSMKILRDLLGRCVPGHPFSFFMLVKLAEVPLLLEELVMVMLTVETLLVSYIVWWTDHTATMSAPETSLMVRCSIHPYLKKRSNHIKLNAGFCNVIMLRYSKVQGKANWSCWKILYISSQKAHWDVKAAFYLFNWVNCFLANNALVLSPSKHTGNFTIHLCNSLTIGNI